MALLDSYFPLSKSLLVAFALLLLDFDTRKYVVVPRSKVRRRLLSTDPPCTTKSQLLLQPWISRSVIYSDSDERRYTTPNSRWSTVSYNNTLRLTLVLLWFWRRFLAAYWFHAKLHTPHVNKAFCKITSSDIFTAVRRSLQESSVASSSCSASSPTI